ncbi:MAG TPA: PEGA domain-containing protein, partial [Gemmatimonadales bacterium]|nr:PEGA domain-containing protein [Gemmatimonadales bacterium]
SAGTETGRFHSGGSAAERCDACIPPSWTMSNTPAAGLTAPDGAVALPTELDARRELAREFQIEHLLGQTPIRYLARDAEDQLLTLTVAPRTQVERSAEEVLEPVAAAKRLDHPHIARVLALGTTDNFVWVATRYVEGRPLASLLRTVGSMELGACLRIFEQVASALDYAHRRGASHGALTAECVIVDANEWVVVDGFGIGEMSPAADQRALALLVRQCLTGGIARTGAGGGLPLHVSQALRRALSARTADQFPSVLDLVAALDDHRGDGRNAQPEARPAWFGATPHSARKGGNPVVIADADQDPAATGGFGRRVIAAAAGIVTLAVAAAWITRSSAPAALPSHAAAAARTAPPPTVRPDSMAALTAPPPAPPAPPAAPPAPPAPPRAAPAPVSRRPAAKTYAPAPVHERAPSPAPAPPPVPPPAPEVRAEPGSLSINAIPWGSVYIDGRPVGNTPQLDLPVPPGQHKLRVERQGYRAYERVIEVAPGQHLRITDITLVER